MQFRDHPGVQGKRDAYPFDPRLLKIDAGFNVRNLDAPDERADLDDLKESIRANGVRVPLEVRLVDEDVFVLAGHRRHKAVMELIAEGEEIKTVPVMPEPKFATEGDRILNLIVSNSGKPLKPLEVAEVVRRLVAFGWDNRQIAKRIGWKSAASVTQHLELLTMPEPVKERVHAGDISATQANKLLKNLPKGTDPNEAAKMIAANKEENKRLGVGKKTNHKVTAKTLKRDAKAKAPEPKEEAPLLTHSTMPEPTASTISVPSVFLPLSDAIPPQDGEPWEQLQAATAKANETLTLAQSGDVDALSQITGDVDNELKAARAYFGSTIGFTQLQANRIDQLVALPAIARSTDPAVRALLNLRTTVEGMTKAPAPARIFPPEAFQPPSLASSINADLFGIVAKLATEAQDQHVEDCSDNDPFLVPAWLGKRALALNAKLIGDESESPRDDGTEVTPGGEPGA